MAIFHCLDLPSSSRLLTKYQQQLTKYQQQLTKWLEYEHSMMESSTLEFDMCPLCLIPCPPVPLQIVCPNPGHSHTPCCWCPGRDIKNGQKWQTS